MGSAAPPVLLHRRDVAVGHGDDEVSADSLVDRGRLSELDDSSIALAHRRHCFAADALGVEALLAVDECPTGLGWSSSRRGLTPPQPAVGHPLPHHVVGHQVHERFELASVEGIDR